MNQSATKSHTPTPYSWGIDDNGFPGLCIYFNDGRVCQLCKTADIDDEAKATAAFIVAACNAHATQAAQIEGLRGVLARLAVLSDDGLPYSPDIHLVREARALLSNLPAAPQTWFDERAAGYVAPSLLQHAYTVLADIRHDWPGRVSPEGQSLLCAMREEVAKQTGSTGEAVSTGVKCDFVRAALANLNA